MKKDINIYISGMGIVFHSGGILKEVEEGQDFFATDFDEPEQVAAHIKKGDIVGFCTGSGGDYTLKFREGYPDADIVKRYPIGARLAIVIDNGKLDEMPLLAWEGVPQLCE